MRGGTDVRKDLRNGRVRSCLENILVKWRGDGRTGTMKEMNWREYETVKSRTKETREGREEKLGQKRADSATPPATTSSEPSPQSRVCPQSFISVTWQ